MNGSYRLSRLRGGGGGGRASELKVFEKGVIGLYAMPVWRGGGAGFLKRLYRGI